jgi:hypothetical protein
VLGAPKLQCSWHKRFDWSVFCDEYRIYVRSREKGREFIPIGWYCTGHKMFFTNKQIERSKRYHVPSKYERYEANLKAVRAKGHKMTPQESGLRTRIRNLAGLYEQKFSSKNTGDDNTDYSPWSEEFIEKLLSLPPTIDELRHVLYSRELVYHINSQNSYRICCWVPDPDKPGWAKWDYEGFFKLLKQDALKQREMMEQIINSRAKEEQVSEFLPSK